MKNFLVSVSFLILAANANSSILLKFCDQHRFNLPKIHKDLNFLKSANDQVRIERNCVEIKTTQAKEELFTKYIMQKYTGIRVDSSQDLSLKEQCKITLTKVTLADIDKTKVGNRKRSIYLNQTNIDKKLDFKGSYSVYSDSPSSIQFDDESFKIICNIRSNGFNISFESESKNLNLNSKVFIMPGQKLMIGSISSDGNEKSTKTQVLQNNIQQKNIEKVAEIYLEVKR